MAQSWLPNADFHLWKQHCYVPLGCPSTKKKGHKSQAWVRPGSGLIVPNSRQARTQSPELGEPASHEQHQS